MTLIKCDECGAKISDKASSCPKCGFPVESNNAENNKNIKIVAAKCPNCGSNIKVNKDDNKTECDFCHSTIIVDDAIERLKITVGGEIEVKNLPKLESILKVAERHYINQEYDEAYQQYSSAIILDPNNTLIILRKGICKSFISNYSKLDIKSSINGFNNAMKIEKDENKKVQYVKEMLDATIKLEEFIFNVYNKTSQIDYDYVSMLINYIMMCNSSFENVSKYTNDKKILTTCYEYLINNCIELLESHEYYSGRYINGNQIISTYILDKSTSDKIEENKQKYLNLLKEINKASYNIIQKKLEEALLTKTSIIRKIIMTISFISGYKIILNSINDSSFPLSGILLIINSILLFKNIFRKICKGKIEAALLLSALLYIILRFII